MHSLFETTPTTSDLIHARQIAGFTRAKAADLCGLHRTSYTRQEKGQTRINLAAYRLLLVCGGWMIEPDWHGWRVCNGKIWSPENIGHTPGDFRSIHWLHQSVRFLRAELYSEKGKEYDQHWFHGYRFNDPRLSPATPAYESHTGHQLELIAP